MPPVAIFAVIVLYKQLPADSPSLQTLLGAAQLAASSEVRLQILVADNTPGGQDPGPLPDGVRYRAAPDNPGLARPYNEALDIAEAEGFEWLLTLDQDTHLPTGFLLGLKAAVQQYAADSASNVAAIVPRIADRGRPISPFHFLAGFFPRVLPDKAHGVIPSRFVSALNSASLLRVEALREVGGYDPRFPLHNSDTSLYQRLDLAGKRVVFASDLLVSHELAILDRAARMSPERYRHMLRDECRFWDDHMGALGRTERLLRLAGRVLKGVLQHEDPVYRNIALDEFKRRLFTSRRSRLSGG